MNLSKQYFHFYFTFKKLALTKWGEKEAIENESVLAVGPQMPPALSKETFVGAECRVSLPLSGTGLLGLCRCHGLVCAMSVFTLLTSGPAAFVYVDVASELFILLSWSVFLNLCQQNRAFLEVSWIFWALWSSNWTYSSAGGEMTSLDIGSSTLHTW